MAQIWDRAVCSSVNRLVVEEKRQNRGVDEAWLRSWTGRSVAQHSAQPFGVLLPWLEAARTIVLLEFFDASAYDLRAGWRQAGVIS